jgi:hypothetical protein
MGCAQPIKSVGFDWKFEKMHTQAAGYETAFQKCRAGAKEKVRYSSLENISFVKRYAQLFSACMRVEGWMIQKDPIVYYYE